MTNSIYKDECRILQKKLLEYRKINAAYLCTMSSQDIALADEKKIRIRTEERLDEAMSVLSEVKESRAKYEKQVIDTTALYEEEKQIREKLEKKLADALSLLEEEKNKRAKLEKQFIETIPSFEEEKQIRLGLEKKFIDVLTFYDEEKKDKNELQNKLNEVLNYARGYYPSRWATWFISAWKSYYYTHYFEIEDNIRMLKEGMDHESCHIIDLICYRNFELLPIHNNSRKFLFKYDEIYEQWELEGCDHTEAKCSFLSRHKIPDGCYLETSVAEFYNGLKLLPIDIQLRLKGKNIIDGGAFWGDSMLAFSEYGPEQIHCFEPCFDNFELLKETTSMNGLEETVTLNYQGLSSDNSKSRLFKNRFHSCNSVIQETINESGIIGSEEISLLTIDEYCKKKSLSIGMIKLDVEGAEYDTILGAKKVICRDKPILLISIYHTPTDFFMIKPLLESWELDYKFMVRKTTYRDIIAEVMLIAYVK